MAIKMYVTVVKQKTIATEKAVLPEELIRGKLKEIVESGNAISIGIDGVEYDIPEKYKRKSDNEQTEEEFNWDSDIDIETIYSIEEIKECLTPVFLAQDVKNAILYGSYAKGCAHEASDVDLLVDSGLRGFDLCGLAEDLRSALTKRVHVYDMRQFKEAHPTNKEHAQKIYEEIMRTGVLIYER